MSAAASSRPPYVSISKIIAEAPLPSAAFSARRRNIRRNFAAQWDYDHVTFVNDVACLRGCRRDEKCRGENCDHWERDLEGRPPCRPTIDVQDRQQHLHVFNSSGADKFAICLWQFHHKPSSRSPRRTILSK